MNFSPQNGTSGHCVPSSFVDQRNAVSATHYGGPERRQFRDSHSELSAEAAELGRALDQYKLTHHRRFINHEEMLEVIRSLGYQKKLSAP
ncbi:MAG: hypothetical protein VYE64_04840 [Planctomycetota bacterium]|nr:hypothetical protein [Planctomycetota bacterium]